MNEIKKHLDEGKVYFGIKQCLKNSKNIDHVVLVSDHRREIANLMKANNLKMRVLELDKHETAERLGNQFSCEVFGIRK